MEQRQKDSFGAGRTAAFTRQKASAGPRRVPSRIHALTFSDPPEAEEEIDLQHDETAQQQLTDQDHRFPGGKEQAAAAAAEEQRENDGGFDVLDLDPDDGDAQGGGDGSNGGNNDLLHANSPFFLAAGKLRNALGQLQPDDALATKLGLLAEELHSQTQASAQMLQRVEAAGSQIAGGLSAQVEAAGALRAIVETAAAKIAGEIRNQPRFPTEFITAVERLGGIVEINALARSQAAEQEPSTTGGAIMTLAYGPRGGPARCAEGRWFRDAGYKNLDDVAAADEADFIGNMLAKAPGHDSTLIARADPAVLRHIHTVARVTNRAIDAVQKGEGQAMPAAEANAPQAAAASSGRTAADADAGKTLAQAAQPADAKPQAAPQQQATPAIQQAAPPAKQGGALPKGSLASPRPDGTLQQSTKASDDVQKR